MCSDRPQTGSTVCALADCMFPEGLAVRTGCEMDVLCYISPSPSSELREQAVQVF